MASFWGAVSFVLCYSLFFFSPENADSYLSGYVVAMTESESQILSPCCNGGVCFWPSYTTGESINSVRQELGGALLASRSWHWIYIALPPEYLRAVLFCLLSQAICVRVRGMLGGNLSLSFKWWFSFSPYRLRGLEFQVTIALVWVCDFRAVHVSDLLFCCWSIKTFTCFSLAVFLCCFK